MNKSGQDHLTDDQLTGLLLEGRLTPQGREHVAHCDACREEMEKITESLGLFNRASLAWSERRPVPSLRARARRQVRRAVYAPLGAALAAALLIGVGVPAWKDLHPAVQGSRATTSGTDEDSPAEIAEDNQLLQSVDVALTRNEASSLPEYRLSESSRGTARAARTP